MIEVNSIVINYTTYQDNEVIEEVDLAFVPWKNDSMDYAFQNSSLLYSVNNFNNSVVSAQHTFDNCSNLQNTPTIPNSVTDVSYMFANCRNMINMYNFSVNRRNVINAQGMFENCPKLTYANVVTFTNAKNLSRAFADCLSLQSIYGIHSLSNVENMDEMLMNTKINGYYYDYQNIVNLSKLQSMRNIFYNCTNMYYSTNISNCPNLIDMSGAFYGCKNIGNSYISECNSVENMAYSYYECYNMNYISEIPQNVTNMYMTFRNCRNLSNIPTIPNNVVDMSATFCDCNRIINAPEIPSSVINIVSEDGVGIFQHCDNMAGIVKIASTEIENAVNTFRGTTLEKSLLIPFKYENGQYTKTYNAFNSAGYSTAQRTEDGVLVFDIDTDPELLSWRFEVIDNNSILYEYLGKENNITVPNNNTMVNCYNASNNYNNQVNLPFYRNTYINSVDLNNVRFVNNSMENAFYSCYSLNEVTNISNTIENMDRTFSRCTNLVNAPVIPNSVTNMYYTFSECNNLVNASDLSNCTNLTNMSGTFSQCLRINDMTIKISNSVTDMSSAFYWCHNLVNAPDLSNCTNLTNMSGTFSYCYNLVNAPVISNSVIDMRDAFYNCINLVNVPVIPNSVTNMTNTFYWCSNIVNVPVIPNSVTSMYGTFCRCYNLKNVPLIGNSINYMVEAFSYCYNLTGDIVILSENISNARYSFSGTSLDKNVYIPFKYENGQYTKTYNAFTYYYTGGYSTTNRVNGVILRDAKLYDWRYEYLNNGIRLLKEYTGGNTTLIVPNNISIINNYNSSYQTDMPFYNNQNLISVDLRQVPFTNDDMSYAFYNSQSIEEVDGIYNVTNMAYAFDSCVNLKNIYITGENITNVYNIFENTNNVEKSIYIPITNSETEEETQTYQTFINEGYSTTVRKNGAILKDITSVDIRLDGIYEYTSDDNNNVVITRYIGDEEIIDTPNV